jgi:glycosyltransferase involved in cell wall biosynthesis
MSTLRTLVFAPNLPYPTFFGVDLRNWQNLNGLMNISQVGIFGLCSNDPRRNQVPRPDLVCWHTSTDPALTYPLPQGQKLTARAWLFDPRGHPSDLYYTDAAAAEIAALVEELKPQIVVLEGLWLHRHIDLLKRYNCRIVLDCHNVEAMLSQQIASATSGNELPAKLVRDILPARVKLIEQKATHAVDQIWVCSRHDAQLMEELYKPSAPIHIVPNAVDVDSYAVVRTGTSRLPATVDLTRRTLIFPAMFAYPPNIGAATFLIEEIFPRLITLFPDCQLLLVGGMPTPQMQEAAKKDPRIVVTGPVPDMRPYLAAASIMVAPLFQGSGTRFKILEAFAAQVPIVSTTKGAEGLQTIDGTHLLIAESADEFVASIQRLWTEESLAKMLTANGLEWVKLHYSWKETNLRIKQAIHQLNNHNIQRGGNSC